MLGAAGFNPESDRQDFGDGTIGRYVFFANAYLEFLWAEEEMRLSLAEADLIDVVADDARLLEVTLYAGKQNRQIDLRPRLPLLLHC
jgi:hypothetical protein